MTIPPAPTGPPPALPSSGTNLSPSKLPQVPIAAVEQITGSTAYGLASFTLQTSITAVLTGEETLAQFLQDIAGDSAAVMTGPGVAGLIAEVIQTVCSAQQIVGAPLANTAGWYAPGPGFNAWRATVGDASMPVTQDGAQYQVCFRLVS